jgi:hypothetical protein
VQENDAVENALALRALQTCAQSVAANRGENPMDSRLARIKELIEQKEAIDNELESLIAGGSVKMRKPKTCTICGAEGHTARTCAKKAGVTAAAESVNKETA